MRAPLIAGLVLSTVLFGLTERQPIWIPGPAWLVHLFPIALAAIVVSRERLTLGFRISVLLSLVMSGAVLFVAWRLG